jgi:hypothetical protein
VTNSYNEYDIGERKEYKLGKLPGFSINQSGMYKENSLDKPADIS